MADISQQINAINSARYGEEVRGSIVTALTAVNDQVEADETSAGASATAAAASAAEAAATEARLASAVEAAEQTEADIEAAEALRVTAEEGRVNAENARVAAEQARENAETGYVAQAQAAAAQAQQYASSDYVKTAQSWAVGGTSSRYGEDTNNSKYWAEVAAQVVTEGGVGSFNGRTGQVLPEAGDYDTTMVSRGTGTAETALASIESGIGSTALPTTAQTITGAIAEHESDISQLNSKLARMMTLKYDSYTFTSSTSMNYTGSSFVIPKNNGYILMCKALYVNSQPQIVRILTASSGGAELASAVTGFNHACAYYIGFNPSSTTTVYAWAQYTLAASNSIQWSCLYVPA